MPTVTPTPGDYTYQAPVHMVPTYYPPGQATIQPPPVMYRVPTPPNTPTSNQAINTVLSNAATEFDYRRLQNFMFYKICNLFVDVWNAIDVR